MSFNQPQNCQTRTQQFLFLFINLQMTLRFTLVQAYLNLSLKPLHLNPGPFVAFYKLLFNYESINIRSHFFFSTLGASLLYSCDQIYAIHISRWFSYKTSVINEKLECSPRLSNVRFLKYARHHTFTIAHIITLDPHFPLMLQKQLPRQ